MSAIRFLNITKSSSQIGKIERFFDEIAMNCNLLNSSYSVLSLSVIEAFHYMQTESEDKKNDPVNIEVEIEDRSITLSVTDVQGFAFKDFDKNWSQRGVILIKLMSDDFYVENNGKTLNMQFDVEILMENHQLAERRIGALQKFKRAQTCQHISGRKQKSNLYKK